MSPRADAPSIVNLEQQRKRAKDLVRAHRQQRAEAALRIRRSLPRARQQSVSEVLAAAFTLSEAQLVVAREAGFASWPSLKRHVEGVRVRPGDVEALIDAAIAGRDEAVQ